eukprot:TRINITY_DN161_c0_g1_i2.p1 TRINITY_DN161_c0_g1~~TRINITY_DN161_c0_g1_i2.p1  ORF type:complete len:124 (-),score=20.97 TRINITY_DN161_c0_g1_i2:145-480(-)
MAYYGGGYGGGYPGGGYPGGGYPGTGYPGGSYPPVVGGVPPPVGYGASITFSGGIGHGHHMRHHGYGGHQGYTRAYAPGMMYYGHHKKWKGHKKFKAKKFKAGKWKGKWKW